MASMNIEGTLSTLFKGMDGYVSSKSVVGEPVYVGDTIIIPLVDVNFGMAAGAFNKQDGNKAAGGIGAKMSPSAVLVISNGSTRLVNLKNQDAVTKIIDMAPEVIDKVVGLFKKDKTEEETAVDQAINEMAQSEDADE
ncbi:MAG: GerW family sporulation protein [Clostridiales bacterium]|nr:GerW family sporulation protein [Clostridiales bacterium]